MAEITYEALNHKSQWCLSSEHNCKVFIIVNEGRPYRDKHGFFRITFPDQNCRVVVRYKPQTEEFIRTHDINGNRLKQHI